MITLLDVLELVSLEEFYSILRFVYFSEVHFFFLNALV